MMIRHRRLVGAVLVVLAGLGLAGLSGCSHATNPWPDKPGLKVVVSFPPLYSFVKNVAGDRATIIPLCTTKGPHHFPYDVKDCLTVRGADLFFALGLGLDESFAKKLNDTSGNPKVKFVELGEIMEEKDHDLLIHPEEAPAKDKKHAGHGHMHGEHDPHIWLGIPQAIKLVEYIRDTLAKEDPEHAGEYKSNAAAYIEKLKALKKDGVEMLSKCMDRKLITFHDSMKYFASPDSFNLKIVKEIEPIPGDTPTPAELADLMAQCKKEGVRVITYETQYEAGSNNPAKLLVAELNKTDKNAAVLIMLDPLETADPRELESPDWYEKKMRENLEALSKALK